MSQVQFNLSLTVTPAPQPLTEGNPSGSASLQQGVAASIILAPITGGTPPYSASVDPNSPNPLPVGVNASIDASNNLIISGTAQVSGGPLPVIIDVSDSAGASVAKASIKL